MMNETVKYGEIIVYTYNNYKGDREVNIANTDKYGLASESITLSISQTRHLLIVLLGMKSELLDDGEGVA